MTSAVDLLADIEAVAARAGGAAPIGRSVEGRPIHALPLGGPSNPSSAAVGDAAGAGTEPVVVLVAGVHGDEPAGVEAAIDVLRRGPRPRRSGSAGVPGRAPALTWVVPCLNPDGLVRRRKDNARAVDLNRNFPARTFTAVHPPGYFPGPSPLCEPESAALAAFLRRAGASHVVAAHAPFGCVNWDGPARAWAERVAGACGWPARADIGYPTPGSLGAWFGGDLGLPIVTLELPPGPFAEHAEATRRALDEALAPGHE